MDSSMNICSIPAESNVHMPSALANAGPQVACKRAMVMGKLDHSDHEVRQADNQTDAQVPAALISYISCTAAVMSKYMHRDFEMHTRAAGALGRYDLAQT